MSRPAVRTGAVVLAVILAAGIGLAQEPPKSKLEAGIALYKAGSYAEAVEAFRQVIRISLLDEELFRAYLYLGYTYFSLQKEEEAKAQVEKAIEIDPGFNPSEADFISEYVAFYGMIKATVVGVAFFVTLPSEAKVFLDDELIGRSPLKKELLAGVYRLRLASPGYEAYEALVELKKAKDSTVKIDFRSEKNWKTFLRGGLIFGIVAFLVGSF